MKVVHPTRDRRPARRLFPLDDPRARRRSITVGLIGTVLFHLLFIFSIPSSYLIVEPGEQDQRFRQFDIEIVTEPEKAEPQYAETNPQAPDNEPDLSENYSSRNQQAANEKKPDELSPDRTPATEGDDIPSSKIITGDLNPPIPVFTSPEVQRPSEESIPTTTPSNPQRVDPLPGFEDDVIVSDEGTGMSEAEAVEIPKISDEPVEGIEADTDDSDPFALPSTREARRPTPQPRPRLPRAPPGPVRTQKAGVSQTGRVGYDAKFSQFGEYMERVVEVVTQRWHALATARSYSETSSLVRIEFKLRWDGSVRQVDTIDTTAKALGILLCRSAIEQGAPYGSWPQEMIDVLGDEQTITFTFHYW